MATMDIYYPQHEKLKYSSFTKSRPSNSQFREGQRQARTMAGHSELSIMESEMQELQWVNHQISDFTSTMPLRQQGKTNSTTCGVTISSSQH